MDVAISLIKKELKQPDQGIAFHDPEQETGYCTCSDYATNKIETRMHLMYASHWYHETKSFKRLAK
jgi:hypothetical protein